MAAAAIPFGLGIGLSLGMLGGGGSVLAVPVLVYILGQTVHQATTASLVVVTAGAVIGSLSHARDGRVCWRHAAGFIAAALPGVIAGTALGTGGQRPRTDRGLRGHHARRRSRDLAQGHARRNRSTRPSSHEPAARPSSSPAS